MKTVILTLTCLLMLKVSGNLCLADPAPSVDTSFPIDCPNLTLRGSLDNSRITFERTSRGTVAFLGGSITEREGYRPLVCQALQSRFSKTKFAFINAGVSSTASITGAFRLQHDVLSHGPIDLLFVEFAVNDDQDGHYNRAECIHGMEGILRHVLLANPNTDVVVTYFVNDTMLASFKNGVEPLSSSSHELVLERYGVSGVELNREVSDRIAAGALTWTQYGGTHPGPIGNKLGASMIVELLTKAWAKPLAAAAVVKPHDLPEPLDPNSYFDGHLVDVDQAQIVSGWTVGTPDWRKIGGGFRQMFANREFISATEPGATLKLAFDGRAVGIYLLAGPDAGIVEASIDGAPFQRFDLFASHSAGLHYPRSIIFNDELPPGRHQLVLRLGGDKNRNSIGTAARIMEFCVN